MSPNKIKLPNINLSENEFELIRNFTKISRFSLHTAYDENSTEPWITVLETLTYDLKGKKA